MIRGVAVRAARQAAVASRAQLARPTVRALSAATLEDKKKGTEAAFIREQEAKRLAEAKAKFEALMKADNASEEKQELIELLAAKPEGEKGTLAKLGLDDWKFALPVGLFIGIPTLANEVLVLSAESQLVACFILFCSTMYTQAGGMIAKSLDEYRENVYTQLKKVDEAQLVDIHASIAANQKVLGMEQDIASVHALIDNLAQAQAQALNAAEEHKYRDAIVKKLDSLVALEEAAVASLRARMLSKVKADVVKTFADDAKAKDKALEAALAVLKTGAGSKLGKDVVGEVYLSSLQSYKAAYAKQPAGSDEILVQLEKDIAATSSAPAIDVKGGNVYETHPLISTAAKAK